MTTVLRIILASIFFVSTTFGESEESPTYAITYNAFETAAFVTLNYLFIRRIEPKLIYVPFHFDAQVKLNEKMGLSFGVVYRYENYQDDGPLYSESDQLRVKKIWTKYHELFLLGGPRFSLQHSGLLGWYFSMKGGIGAAYSPSYFNVSLVAQPECGYTMSFANPGFHLTFGLGLLGNLPIFETRDFAVPWKANKQKLSAIGILVHQIIPIVNVGVGMNW